MFKKGWDIAVLSQIALLRHLIALQFKMCYRDSPRVVGEGVLLHVSYTRWRMTEALCADVTAR